MNALHPGPRTVPFAAPLAAVHQWSCAQATPVPSGTAWEASVRTRVDGRHPALRGHFPGLVVLPGVYVLEALGQLVALVAGEPGAPGLGLLTLRSVRFAAPLLDGDELGLDATGRPLPHGGWDVRATARRADGTVTARLHAEFGAALPAADPGGSRLPSGPGAAAHHTVRALLPQRYPLLLVDRVLELVAGDRIRTVKAVSGTDPCYAHLSDGVDARCHDYPGSLVVESFGQSAALLWLDGADPAPDDRVLMFVGARGVRFEAVARPGDVLRHEVRLEAVLADTAFATGETWVGDQRIASFGSLIATRRPARLPSTAPATAGAGH